MFTPLAPNAHWRVYRPYLAWAKTRYQHTWGVRHIRAHLSHLAGKVLSTKGARRYVQTQSGSESRPSL